MAQSFIGYQAMIEVFRDLGRRSSVFDAKVMAKKTQIFKGIL